MIRIKVIRKHPNRNIEKCLENFIEIAKNEKKFQLENNFLKSLASLRKYPLKLKNVDECALIQHFGSKICEMIGVQLQIDKCTSIQSIPSTSKPTNYTVNSQPSTCSIFPSKVPTASASRAKVSTFQPKTPTKSASQTKVSTFKPKTPTISASRIKVSKFQPKAPTISASQSNASIALFQPRAPTTSVSQPKQTNDFNHSKNKRVVEPKHDNKVITATERFTFDSGTFDIILLVDTSEKTGFNLEKGATQIDVLQKSGINYEIRHLNVGDFLWIARSRITQKELVLPYIIERKRYDDLGKSITDGRFHEQKFRLKTCGLQNIIYLVEGLQDSNNLYGVMKPAVLSQASINSLVQDNFTVKYSRNHVDSILYLITMSKKLENYFKNKRLISTDKNNLIKMNINQHEITLQQFDKFNKLSIKNKVFSVNEMFIKQLLQLSGLSVERTMAIVKKYPTPIALKRAMINDPDFQKNFANIKFGPLKRNIGGAIAKNLHLLYTSKQFK